MTQLVLDQPEGVPARALALLLGQPLGLLTVTDPVLRPAALSESRPDGLLVADDADRPARVVIEVQLRPDQAKADNWPWYLALAERTAGVRAVLLVVALDVSTAAWARALVADDPRLATRAVVIGPEEVPRFDALPADERTIDAALWSTAMHVQGARDLSILRALTDPALPWRSDTRPWNEYLGSVMRLLPAGMEEALRGVVMGHTATDTTGMEDIVALFRRVYGQAEREAGRQEGRQEGSVDARRQSLRKVLRARGETLTPEQSALLDGCRDEAKLDEWQDRLLAGESAESCFAR